MVGYPTKAGYPVSLSGYPASVEWVFSKWKLRSGVTRLIKSLKRGELFWQFHLQHVVEIDSAGDNLEVKSNSQANQLNRTNKVFACNGATTLKRKVALSEQTTVIYACV